ncbi:hypothetical protein [Rubrivirga litoralis]|uniref:Outer membrane protein beta-barrel domain-containing protein n=1 Tax=Rubrivirga litoralis TaxID=3075598 RepID=A0ABU3BSV0_9BACT|nr:hypothetical protein [Rubrivirga sp. F394]MDT0632241.1 hypothetical protein [Rubrivirga sp. F394]
MSRTPHVLAALALLFVFAGSAAAQPRPLGVGVKVGVEPQVGLDLHLGETVGLRLLTSLTVGNDDAFGTSTVAVPLRFPAVRRVAVFVGPSVTFVNFEDVAFAGGIVGVEYDLGSRVSLVGEVGLDVGIDDGFADFSTGVNTGVGAFYRF